MCIFVEIISHALVWLIHIKFPVSILLQNHTQWLVLVTIACNGVWDVTITTAVPHVLAVEAKITTVIRVECCLT